MDAFSIDLNAATQQSGMYYNSVTDSYQALPKGAPTTGNNPNPATTALEDVWNEIGDDVSAVGGKVAEGARSAVKVVKEAAGDTYDAIGNEINKVQWGMAKWILLGVGCVAVLIYVSGKSGAVNLKSL